MKKIAAILLILAAMTTSAFAEEALPLPPDAVTADEGWILPSGEVIELITDENGTPISIITATPAVAAKEEEQSREGAEAAVLADYPSALILSAESKEDGSRETAILTEELSGRVTVHGDAIISRELAIGNFIHEGQLTADGAKAALSLLRPDAKIAEIELDNDDGLLIYEGEAYLNGAEYEFELNAQTAKLLEWERD